MSSARLAPWLVPAWTTFVSAVRHQRLGHALFLAGEPGLGKRELAQRMARRLLCQSPGDDEQACGQCKACVWYDAGTHPDLHIVRPDEDSDSLKVDQIRDLIARLMLTGQAGPIRVAVIEPADAMTVAAQNALLKTLEEPPAGVHLILVADAPERLLPTVRSRCQAYPVTVPAASQVGEWLAGQGRNVSPLAVALAAGHPGTALAWSEPDQLKRLQAVAADLVDLRQQRQSPLAVAARWAQAADEHVDIAIAWLRLWTWAGAGHRLAADVAAPADVRHLGRAQGDALRLRERLRAPLKPTWLLHEWLQGWQAG